MNIKVFLLFLFIPFVLTAQKPTIHGPKKSQWVEINDFVRSQWDNQLSKSTDLPHIYIGPFPDMSHIFYWDTYFTNVGLYVHKMDATAGGNTKNLLSVVAQNGYMGNAAVTTWGMNRSQPPYLSAMVRDYFEKTGGKDTTFLKMAYPLLKREYHFWTDTSSAAIEQHNTTLPVLQRFAHHATREEMLEFYVEIANRFSLSRAVSEKEKISKSIPYLVEAATGMDFTGRFENRAQDFVAVELNTLLFVYERNFDWMVKLLDLKDEPDWAAKAERRKELINRYCWDETRGLFLDYDFVNGRRSKVAAITTFQPLWAGMASDEQAARIVGNMSLFESEFGMATTEAIGQPDTYQWGETSVWAPMQLLTVMGLQNYGYKTEAERVASKFLDLLVKNYQNPKPTVYIRKGSKFKREPGNIYEKYRTDGTINDLEYPAREMMGWTGGAAAYFYKLLLPAPANALERNPENK